MTTPQKYTLSKEERLSWKRYIDLLFEQGQSFIAFPLRVVYLPVDEVMSAPLSMLVSVSKKRFKRAVKRNQIKRQVREAYRLRKPELVDHFSASGKPLLVAFIYVDKEIHPHTDIERAMNKAVVQLKKRLE